MLLKLLGEATSSSTVTVRIGAEGPYQELATTSVVATGYGPGDEALATLGHRGTDPHGLPGIDGGGARGRALRQPDPRRRMNTAHARPAPRAAAPELREHL